MPLVVIPTPIGNMEDITLRAIRELKEAHWIACEDTRHTGMLLKKLSIKGRLFSCHEHNERDRISMVMEKLEEGQKVAMVSDAGTPGMSDPGYEIIHSAIERGYNVDILPGANAFVPAVLQSGLKPHPFLFYGFLSDKRGEREALLDSLKDCPFTLIFYVSPHKALKHVRTVIEILGDREAALVREITKMHEETIRGKLSHIEDRIRAGLKGEMVLVVEGKLKKSEDEVNWESRAMELKDRGLSDKEIAYVLSEEGIAKNKVKKWLLLNK